MQHTLDRFNHVWPLQRGRAQLSGRIVTIEFRNCNDGHNVRSFIYYSAPASTVGSVVKQKTERSFIQVCFLHCSSQLESKRP